MQSDLDPFQCQIFQPVDRPSVTAPEGAAQENCSLRNLLFLKVPASLELHTSPTLTGDTK